MSQMRNFNISNCQVYASHWKHTRPNRGFQRKETLANLLLELSHKIVVTHWFICQSSVCTRFFHWAQLASNTLKSCSPCWKRPIWNEKCFSSLQWKCKPYSYIGWFPHISNVTNSTNKRLLPSYLQSVCQLIKAQQCQKKFVSGKQPLPFFHQGLSRIKRVTDWLRCQKLLLC